MFTVLIPARYASTRLPENRIDFESLAGGRAITIYPQGDVVRDLTDARLNAGGQVLFEADDVSVHGFDGESPSIRFRHDGRPFARKDVYLLRARSWV